MTLPLATKELNVSQGKSQVVMADKARCTDGGPYSGWDPTQLTHFMDEPTRKKLSQGDTLEPAGPGLCLLNYQVFPKLEIEADPQDP